MYILSFMLGMWYENVPEKAREYNFHMMNKHL